MSERNGHPDLVIFDCDGVLVDSEPIAIRIDAEIFAEYGMPMSEEEIIERFVGRSPSVTWGALEEHLGHPLPADFRTRTQAMFDAAYEHDLMPIAGIEEALDQITALTCVASSSDPDRLDHKLRLTGLYDRFAGRIYSAAAVRNGKPAPDLFLYAAQQMDVEPGACAVIEDSQYGVQAARAAGMAAFGYTGSVTPAHMLEGPGTTVFGDMRELPRLLQSR
ncbi:MAG TPA: HAD family hydrolase [Solirubrobacteraceae bacterium]|nr:HAD family hydrolase [Solirubrobacteraceae bacterium]